MDMKFDAKITAIKFSVCTGMSRLFEFEGFFASFFFTYMSSVRYEVAVVIYEDVFCARFRVKIAGILQL